MTGIWVILEGSNEALHINHNQIQENFKLKDDEEIFEPYLDQKALFQIAINRLGCIYRITDGYPDSPIRIVRTISDSKERDWDSEVFYMGTDETTNKHILKYVGHRNDTMDVIY